MRTIEDAIHRQPAPRTVHLATGLYRGPFELPPGIHLKGDKSVVLYAEGKGTVLRGSDLRLERLHVQGGATGLLAQGSVELVQVSFSGQRQLAVALPPGTRARIKGGLFQGSISETVGLRVEQGAEAALDKVVFTGAFRRAVEVKGGSAFLEDCRFEGPATALHVAAGSARISRLVAFGGREPALFVSAARLWARQVAVDGHEYGLMASNRAELDLEDLVLSRSHRAALALVSSRARIRDLVVKSAGTFGAVQSIDSELDLERLRVFGAQGSGLMARGGRLHVRNAAVRSINADGESRGDALELRGVEAVLEDVDASSLEGSGVYCTMAANVKLQGLRCEHCRYGGLVVERASKVEARDLEISSSAMAAVAVVDGGSLRLGMLRSTNNPQGALWAECDGGAEVELEPGPALSGLPPGPCVRSSTGSR